MMRIVPYILKGKIQPGDWSDAFRQLHLDSLDDRLSENYVIDRLNLDKMYNFNFTYDGDDLVQVSGCQIFSENVVRVFSRYYVFNEYRTDSRNSLDKSDNFEELKYSLDTLDQFKLIIWSRDSSAGFFKRLKRGRPDIFTDWTVYDKRIELMYSDNYQYIFYTGDISYLNDVIYDNSQDSLTQPII
tara:strand:+ start:815 stop:1372 length:558 start_codon:yes stop_codon:yes gene_type:complete